MKFPVIMMQNKMLAVRYPSLC